MIKREFTAIFQKSGRWVLAWVEEIPGVNTQGRTMKEAKENLREALSLVLEENRKISALRSYDAKREVLRVSVSA